MSIASENGWNGIVSRAGAASSNQPPLALSAPQNIGQAPITFKFVQQVYAEPLLRQDVPQEGVPRPS